MKKIVIILIVLLLFTSNVIASDKHEAWAITQTYVESQLKAPSTARFSRIPWRLEGGKLIDYGVGSYYIKAYVDAQNVYGAMLRKWFEITVTEEHGTWKASNFHWLKK